MINVTAVKSMRYYAGPRLSADASSGPVPGPESRIFSEHPASSSQAEPQMLCLRSRALVHIADATTFFFSFPGNFTPQVNMLHDLFEGIDPLTLQKLPGSRRNGGRGGAIDIQLSVPKSVSVAAAMLPGSEDWFAKISAVQIESAIKTIQFANKNGLLVTRQDRQFQPVHTVFCAVFQHFNSRAEDPQTHGHSLLLNTALRQDGRLCQLDSYLLKRYQHTLAAVARSYEISGLRKLGLHIEEDGQSYRIAGVPDALCKLFSKRRKVIEETLESAGLTPSLHRIAAQHAAYKTRAAKTDARDFAALRTSWVQEAAASGFTPELLKSAIFDAARDADVSVAGALPKLEDVVAAAIAALCEHKATFTRPQLLHAVFEQTQYHGFDPDLVLDALFSPRMGIEPVAAPGQIPVYTHRSLRVAEQELISLVAASRGASRPVSAELVNLHLADTVNANLSSHRLSEEQEAAVRHITLQPDGVVCVSGAAGSGKSVSLSVARSIFEDNSQRVFGTALSWRATEELRKSAGLRQQHCSALAKMLHDLRTGDMSLNAGDVVLVDEAGMVGTQQFTELLRFTSAAGARLIAVGDTEQLKPVAAGAPFQLLRRLVPVARIDTIKRQTGRSDIEGAQMRAATQAFARGEIGTGLEYYERTGALSYQVSRTATISAAADGYLDHMLHHPVETRAMTAQWNTDCHELNAAIRERMVRHKLLGARSVTFPALTRGSKSKAQPLELRAGDLVMCGENVKIGEVTIRNGSIVKVLNISGPDALPELSIELETGSRISATPDQLLGSRREGATRAAIPVLQHGYCFTAHAAQGMTVDAHFDVALHRRCAESTYVCASRHRKSLRVFVDASRVAADEQERRTRTHLASAHRSVNPRKTEPVSLTGDDIRAAFFTECERSERAANISDYIAKADLLKWSAGAQAGSPAPPVRAPGARKAEGVLGRPCRIKILQRLPAARRQALAVALHEIAEAIPLGAVEPAAEAVKEPGLEDAVRDLCAKDFTQAAVAARIDPAPRPVPLPGVIASTDISVGAVADDARFTLSLPAVSVSFPVLKTFQPRRRIVALPELLKSGFSAAFEYPGFSQKPDFTRALSQIAGAISLRGPATLQKDLAGEGVFAPVLLDEPDRREAVFFDPDKHERMFLKKVGQKLGLEHGQNLSQRLLQKLGMPQMSVRDDLLVDGPQRSALQFPGLLKSQLTHLSTAFGSLVPLLGQAPKLLAARSLSRSAATTLTNIKMEGTVRDARKQNSEPTSAWPGDARSGGAARTDHPDLRADEISKNDVRGATKRQLDHGTDAEPRALSSELECQRAGHASDTKNHDGADAGLYSNRTGAAAEATSAESGTAQSRCEQSTAYQRRDTSSLDELKSSVAWRMIMSLQIARRHGGHAQFADHSEDIHFYRSSGAVPSALVARIKADKIVARPETPHALLDNFREIFALPIRFPAPKPHPVPSKEAEVSMASRPAQKEAVSKFVPAIKQIRRREVIRPAFDRVLYDPNFLQCDAAIPATTGYINSLRDLAGFDLVGLARIDVAVPDLLSPELVSTLSALHGALSESARNDVEIIPFIPAGMITHAPTTLVFVFNPEADFVAHFSEIEDNTLIVPVRSGVAEGTDGIDLCDIETIVLHVQSSETELVADAPDEDIAALRVHIETVLMPAGLYANCSIIESVGDCEADTPPWRSGETGMEFSM